MGLSLVAVYTKPVKRLNARHNQKGRMGLGHQGSPESRLVVASTWEKWRMGANFLWVPSFF